MEEIISLVIIILTIIGILIGRQSVKQKELKQQTPEEEDALEYLEKMFEIPSRKPPQPAQQPEDEDIKIIEIIPARKEIPEPRVAKMRQKKVEFPQPAPRKPPPVYRPPSEFAPQFLLRYPRLQQMIVLSEILKRPLILRRSGRPGPPHLS
jgi:hypothetical protein